MEFEDPTENIDESKSKLEITDLTNNSEIDGKHLRKNW